jgi:hypothetical protein
MAISRRVAGDVLERLVRKPESHDTAGLVRYAIGRDLRGLVAP